jgi:predicted Zn-dependent protease
VSAAALQSIGKVNDAIATLERARASHPNDVDILTALARFTEDRGDVARARQYTEHLHALGRRDRK